jgi:hypothetical protein
VLTENRRRRTERQRTDLSAQPLHRRPQSRFPRPDALPLHNVNVGSGEQTTEDGCPRRLSPLLMKAKPAAGRTALAPNLAFKLMFHRNVARGDLSSDFHQASVFRRLSCAVCLAPSVLPSSVLRLVEPDGIEPTTSCLQSTRSPN